MEFIEGQPLQGPLPVSRAIAHSLDILSALEAAQTVEQHHLGKGHIVGQEPVPKPIRGLGFVAERILRAKERVGKRLSRGQTRRFGGGA